MKKYIPVTVQWTTKIPLQLQEAVQSKIISMQLVIWPDEMYPTGLGMLKNIHD